MTHPTELNLCPEHPIILHSEGVVIYVTATRDGILIERIGERKGRDGTYYNVKVPILTLPHSADDEFIPGER